ncbi:MAG: hypothetical protein J5706_09225 [Elusimicrobiales bacterium]|nr:hypothetical protein [Elusimicrobiales bacterium]
MEKILAGYLKSPCTFPSENVPSWLPSAGMWGYVAGYVAFFAYMRLSGSAFPGFFSLLLIMLLMLASEMIGAAIIHFFISLSGKKGNASTIFYLFGCSCYLLTLLLPIGFMAMFSKAAAALAVLALFAAMFVVRVKMLRRAYENISVARSVLAMFVPNLLIQGMIFLSLIYGIVNGIWLIKMSV